MNVKLITEENTEISSFDFKNFDYLKNQVFPLWQPSCGDKNFKELYVEYVIRNNIFENKYQFELLDCENKEFYAAAFFARKKDTCLSELCFDKNFSALDSQLTCVAEDCRTYLEYMDKKTFSLMKEDDIKLSLFISVKKGAGFVLFNSLCKKLKEEGYKNIFLWTDCECDWQWYINHGFELIEESVYEKYSNSEKVYKTFIFKKSIS